MNSKSLHLIKDIKTEFEAEFLINIKIVYVFNDNQKKSNLFLVTKDDKILTFGGNAFGVLGFGHKNQINCLTINKVLSNRKLVELKNGFQHMIGRTSDGKIYCWGFNKWGVLGNGRLNEKIYKPEANKYLKNIVEISSGFWHSLALTDKGQVYSWGDNTWGQTGFGTDRKDIGFKPKLLDAFDGQTVVSISCGAYHSLALTKAGLVFSWGNNECGQLGHGVEGHSNYPMPILKMGVQVIKISAGFDHNMILSKDGFIYTFGCNECGELGWPSGAYNKQCVPQRLEHSETFSDIETENFYPFSAALSTSGQYYIWGLSGTESSYELISEPKIKNSYNSFEELFIEELKITHKPIHCFNDNLKRRISIQLNDIFNDNCD